MESNEYTKIKQLLERFFDGETTNAEEQELYRFFNRPDLPASLKPYRSTFDYFETGMAREVAERATPAPELPARKVTLKRYVIAGITVAASLVLFIVLNNKSVEKEERFNPYAGSYAIHNGMRTELPEEKARERHKAVLKTEREKLMIGQTISNSDRYFRKITEKQRQIETEMEERNRHIDELEKEYLNKN